MFQVHNPAQHTFNWYCNLIGAQQNDTAPAAERLRDIVKKIQKDYTSPFGIKFPYEQQSFQNGYLVAYFPYYIEPIYHVLKSANLPDELFSKDNLQVSFFGGGPCPEALGLAAYLREKAPNLKSVDISSLTGRIVGIQFNRAYFLKCCQTMLLNKPAIRSRTAAVMWQNAMPGNAPTVRQFQQVK